MGHRALFVGAVKPPLVAAMAAWLKAGNEIAACWIGQTRTPGPLRRDRRLSRLFPAKTVSGLARTHGFPVRTVPRLSRWESATDEVRATGADVLISVYCPFLIPTSMLDLFGARAVNFHPAPLPRYRGPNPIHAMILDRTILTDGAMTLHVLAAGLDEGAIVGQLPVPFPADLDMLRYDYVLAAATARLAGDLLPRYLAGEIDAVPQDPEVATYLKISLEEQDLSSDLSSDEIRWRCRTLARTRPLEIAGIDGARIAAFDTVLGPPTGRPPVIGRFSVEFDAADARVRVRRRAPLAKQVRGLREIAMRAAMTV